MKEQLSKTEIGKDVLQESVEAVASTVGQVTSIITTAVKDVATALGGLATDVFEIADGARKANEDFDDFDDDLDVDADEAPADPVKTDEAE
ncbi:hypothetical protein ACT17_07070 [Mycolicibacterium conceptionense]|jgi:hypothetical protein|uniref:Uncharacterized protein n=2 Tax=Mycolicibacterium TaxID=1866885 RepID=A0A0J8UFM8_9MYCO|nr:MULTISPECIES: hypothetical protein [Mycolicibacterium]KMV19200.1 hypothetical protein ACT17_07070 [Mycolicibacterium conceptionense]OBK08568.1 hypothetical protein A5639_12890 [Mycolicibacterium conceptionense]OMB80371.1 hypothetical protein A5746_05985 [Mycolicibacterium conceptionense]OMB87297.1 hypothetical protein A5741_16165 [Mycolicibacterium conceptionense]ORV22032.1 hypothetical protein AWB98_24800 [Mycolicibacterium conceptionense]